MKTLRYSLQVHASCEAVFRFIDDESMLGLWMEGVEHTVFLDETKQVGSRFRQHIREGRHLHAYQGEIIRYDPPHEYATRVGNQVFTMEVGYRLTPNEEGCRLDYEAVMSEANWFIDLMSALFHSLTRKLLQRHMQNLKALAESNSPGATPLWTPS